MTLSAYWKSRNSSVRHQDFIIASSLKRTFTKATKVTPLIALVLLLFSSLAAASPHHKLKLEGWNIYIEQKLVDKNDVRVFLAMRLLSEKLREIKSLLPADAIKQLETVPIFFSENKAFNAEYYFFEPYVYRTGKDIKMMNGIEFRSISFFIEESKYSPMLLLHEMAHAYHKMNYRRIDKMVMRAYRHAETKHLYQNVMSVTNQYTRAYALQSPFEYFAELTEAYFGRNNFYPFERSELEEYDAMGFEMVKKAWLQ